MQIPLSWGGSARSGVQRWPQLDSTWPVLSATMEHRLLFTAGVSSELEVQEQGRKQGGTHTGWPEGLGPFICCIWISGFSLKNL